MASCYIFYEILYLYFSFWGGHLLLDVTMLDKPNQMHIVCNLLLFVAR